jgi:hypothetical protein
MTLAYYTLREQVSRANADRAKSGPARISHLALAAAYGTLARGLRRPPVLRRRRRPNAVDTPSTAEWENEGGASR